MKLRICNKYNLRNNIMKIGLVKVSVLQIKRPNLSTRRFTAVVLEGLVLSTTPFPICFQTTTVRCCSCSHFMETLLILKSGLISYSLPCLFSCHLKQLIISIFISIFSFSVYISAVDNFHLYLHLQHSSPTCPARLCF